MTKVEDSLLKPYKYFRQVEMTSRLSRNRECGCGKTLMLRGRRWSWEESKEGQGCQWTSVLISEYMVMLFEGELFRRIDEKCAYLKSAYPNLWHLFIHLDSSSIFWIFGQFWCSVVKVTLCGGTQDPLCLPVRPCSGANGGNPTLQREREGRMNNARYLR